MGQTFAWTGAEFGLELDLLELLDDLFEFPETLDDSLEDLDLLESPEILKDLDLSENLVILEDELEDLDLLEPNDLELGGEAKAWLKTLGLAEGTPTSWGESSLGLSGSKLPGSPRLDFQVIWDFSEGFLGLGTGLPIHPLLGLLGDLHWEFQL